jgi:preprotein translocase subunit SecF
MFNIVGKRSWFFLLSAIIIVAGVVMLAVFGLEPSIEFSSGSLLTVHFEQTLEIDQVRAALNDAGYSSTVIQRTGEGDFLIRLPTLNSDQKAALETTLTGTLGNLEVKGFDSVSPMVAAETVRNATIAVIVSAVGMLLYISWAFHRVPNPLRWGICAIVTLTHDILAVVGIYAILSFIFGWQIDLMFITGILTVVGYSVNDTIVIFDRIRENLRRTPNLDFEMIVNRSLTETMSRSLITGLGVIFVLIALLIVVGTAILNLAVVLLIGIAVGTYGSICNAAPLLVVWQKGEWGKLMPWSRRVNDAKARVR